jgi:hypothetical protein
MKKRPIQFGTNSKFVVVGVFVVGFLLVLVARIGFSHLNQVPQDWPQTSGVLLGTKVEPAEFREKGFNSRALYQAYAHVQYATTGNQNEGWYPVLKISSSREQLQYELSTKSVASVRWNPKSPAVAVVTLQ